MASQSDTAHGSGDDRTYCWNTGELEEFLSNTSMATIIDGTTNPDDRRMGRCQFLITIDAGEDEDFEEIYDTFKSIIWRSNADMKAQGNGMHTIALPPN